MPGIAVLPFEVNAGKKLDHLRQDLHVSLGEKLAARGYKVVDKNQITSVIVENNMTYLDIAVARDIGLLVSANWVIYGSFTQVSNTISMDVRLVDALGLRPAKPLFVVQEHSADVDMALNSLVEKLNYEFSRRDRVEIIEVEGTSSLDKDVVLMRMRLKKGDLYTAQKINEELRNIYALGYFDDVQVATENLPEGMKVIFIVREKPTIQVIDIVGTDVLDEDDVLALLTTKAGSIVNPKILADDLARVKSEYSKKGYYNVKVSHELETGATGRARLNIIVDEGQKLYIKEIHILGAKALDADDIKSELALKERGFLSWFTGSGVLKQEMLERDTAIIQSYYGARGFLEARSGQPNVEFEEDGIVVSFKVKEGRRFTLGDVSYQGDLLETKDVLNGVVKRNTLQDDGYINRSGLREATQKLTRYYAEYGYAFADASYKLDINEEELQADVVFHLQKRQKMYISRVIIEGNTHTRDNVIRREMRLADGDVFNGKNLGRSVQRLNRLGYFEMVDIQPVPTEDPAKVDLKVKVKEGSTGEFSAGVGWADAYGVYALGRIKQGNLFGKGYFVSLDATLSSDITEFSATFLNPSVLDSQWHWGVNAYAQDFDYFDEYKRDSIGVRTWVGHPIGEYTKWSASYRLEKFKVTDVDNDAADAIKDMVGREWLHVVKFSIERDTLDRKFNPTKGSTASLSVEYGGGILGGDEHYIKYEADYNKYLPLWSEHVLHLHGQVGHVAEQPGEDDEVPVYHRLYLGGMNTVRGYELGYIAPRDPVSDDLIGGETRMFANVEYIFPILEESGVMGLLFYDIGDVWDYGEDIRFNDMKQSIGGGIRWYSPMGPLRLEYGYALDDIPHQGSRGRAEFSVGQFF